MTEVITVNNLNKGGSKMKKKEVKRGGKIQVTVQTEDRLKAINNLSEAIRDVARALVSNVRVIIKDSAFNHIKNGIAVNIDTAQKVEKTEIKEL